jgi:hypothetical protein
MEKGWHYTNAYPQLKHHPFSTKHIHNTQRFYAIIFYHVSATLDNLVYDTTIQMQRVHTSKASIKGLIKILLQSYLLVFWYSYISYGLCSMLDELQAVVSSEIFFINRLLPDCNPLSCLLNVGVDFIIHLVSLSIGESFFLSTRKLSHLGSRGEMQKWKMNLMGWN